MARLPLNRPSGLGRGEPSAGGAEEYVWLISWTEAHGIVGSVVAALEADIDMHAADFVGGVHLFLRRSTCGRVSNEVMSRSPSYPAHSTTMYWSRFAIDGFPSGGWLRSEDRTGCPRLPVSDQYSAMVAMVSTRAVRVGSA